MVILVEVVIVVPTLKRGLFAPNFSNPLCCILTGIIPLVFSIVIIEPLGLLRCILNSIEILKMLKTSQNVRIQKHLLAILEESWWSIRLPEVNCLKEDELIFFSSGV